MKTPTKQQSNLAGLLRNQRGAALVELIIAVLVVGLVLTALATSLTYSILVTSAARKQDVANSIAQDAIETFHKERALAGWNTFYAYFNSNTGLICVDQAASAVLDNNGTFENRNFSSIFTAVSNEQQITQQPDCKREVSGVGTPFYQKIDVSSSGNSIIVSVDVYWDVSNTGEKSLVSPIVKIFRKTD